MAVVRSHLVVLVGGSWEPPQGEFFDAGLVADKNASITGTLTEDTVERTFPVTKDVIYPYVFKEITDVSPSSTDILVLGS